VGGGILTDRFDKRAALVALTGVQAASMGLVVFGRAPFAALLFCAIFGLTLGARSPLALSIRADYFGRKAYATLWGVSLLFANIGGMAGMVATGYLADRFGGYQAAFATVALLTGIAALLFAKARRPSTGAGVTGATGS
jgi:predicted MFS family arabinose efflux permease